MTDEEKIYNHWATCLKACLAEGLAPGDVVGPLLHLTAGCMKGLIGPETAREDILRLRDDLHRELTHLAGDKRP